MAQKNIGDTKQFTNSINSDILCIEKMGKTMFDCIVSQDNYIDILGWLQYNLDIDKRILKFIILNSGLLKYEDLFDFSSIDKINMFNLIYKYKECVMRHINKNILCTIFLNITKFISKCP